MIDRTGNGVIGAKATPAVGRFGAAEGLSRRVCAGYQCC